MKILALIVTCALGLAGLICWMTGKKRKKKLRCCCFKLAGDNLKCPIHKV